jgi:hypothetical protein
MKQKKNIFYHFGIHDENVPDIVFVITNQGTTNYVSVPTITITPATAGLGTGAH